MVRALREGLIANDIESICGILNGTCNYILTRMEKDNLTFGEALEEAKAMISVLFSSGWVILTAWTPRTRR